MISRTQWTTMLLQIVVATATLIPAVYLDGQVNTQTTTTTQASNVETTVQRGEVVFVHGNDLIVKMEDGTLRHFANVPDSVRVTVDGKELGIHDLKVGMKLEKTITTTTTPKVITTVQTVTGKVWQVNPPNTVILTLADGSNQLFKIPENQKFNINGQMVDAWHLKKGMNVSATRVVEEPVTEVTHKQELTGSMPPPPPPPPADVPILVAVLVPAPHPSAPEPPKALPKTGSELPLFGFVGLISLAAALGLRMLRIAMYGSKGVLG
jgi:LPXTG-motif cell wall-anchored protein